MSSDALAAVILGCISSVAITAMVISYIQDRGRE